MSDNQHYVTRAYLEKFIRPDSVQRVLYPYQKSIGATAAKGTKHLASADCFYVQNVSGELSNRLDEARKFLETKLFASGRRTSGALANCIYDDKFYPSIEQVLELATVAAFLHCGAPMTIHNTAMMGVFCNQAHALNTLKTKAAKEEYERSYGAAAEAKIAEDRQQILNGELIIDVGEENWKQQGFFSFKMAEVWMQHLTQMGLTICSAHRD